MTIRFEGEIAKYPEELFRIAFETAEKFRESLPFSSTGSHCYTKPSELKGVRQAIIIPITEVRSFYDPGREPNDVDDNQVGCIKIKWTPLSRHNLGQS
jgi:hypothetical protein